MPHELISQEYLQQLVKLHQKKNWGTSAHFQTSTVAEFVRELAVKVVLDYGCGQGTLRPKLLNQCPTIEVREYDPAIAGKDDRPTSAELVVCIDVLEHIEPDKLDSVLKDLYELSEKAAFFVIATRPAIAKLPDGRNAHLIVESPDYWADKILASGWSKINRHRVGRGEYFVWLLK